MSASIPWQGWKMSVLVLLCVLTSMTRLKTVCVVLHCVSSSIPWLDWKLFVLSCIVCVVLHCVSTSIPWLDWNGTLYWKLRMLSNPFFSQSLCQLCSDVTVFLHVQPKLRRCSVQQRWPQPWWTSTWRWPPRTLSGRQSSRACRRSWSSSTPARSVNCGAAAAAGQQATRLLSDWSIERSPLNFTLSCDCFYIVLFLTLEQTHAFVTLWLCMSYCCFFTVHFGYSPKWCPCSAFGLLHGRCLMKLLPFRCILCTPTTKQCTMSQLFMQSHICSLRCMHV